MDVDGTLTDGKIYMGADGEAFKAFDIKDGYALHTLVKENGIIPVIITARKSPMVIHRCEELGVTEIHQGVLNKLDCLKAILREYSSTDQQYDFSNVAYIGDDLLDLKCMQPIKAAGGSAGCPSNAVKDLIAICDYVSPYRGGEGAVRDYVEYLIKQTKKTVKNTESDVVNRINEAIEYVSKLDHANLMPGKYFVNDNFFYLVQEYEAVKDEQSVWESHRKYVDIQWIISGCEKIYVSDIQLLQPLDGYDEVSDIIHYHKIENQTAILLTPGSCAILYPKDGHRPSRYLGQPCIVRKIVGKVRV